jgi:ABC-2 type transport system ATP-binding protein
MTDTVIEAVELTKSYPGGVQALRGASFAVPAGTLFGLLGPNGAGKSTTVKVLTTLARADSGSATVAGYDVRRDAGKVRRCIGVVGQRLSSIPLLTAHENVALQGRMYGLRGRPLTQRTAETLARLGLDEVADRQTGRLSGGMRRRVDIAMGLVHRPGILFLDEPTTGLDPDIRIQLWDDLAALVRDDGLSILLTTHYLEEADRLADQVAIIDRGRVVATGHPEALKQELRGETLRVELAAPVPDPDRLARTLAGVAGLIGCHLDGRLMHARAEDAGAAVPLVLAALDRGGMRATTVTVARPSLDDVYLRYTGHQFAAIEPATLTGAPS